MRCCEPYPMIRTENPLLLHPLDRAREGTRWWGRRTFPSLAVDRLSRESASPPRMQRPLLAKYDRRELFPATVDQSDLDFPGSCLGCGDGTEGADFHEGAVEGGTSWSALRNVSVWLQRDPKSVKWATISDSNAFGRYPHCFNSH